MVIDRTPPKPKPPEPSEVKAMMLKELSEADDGMLALAYMYAKDFRLCGEDITKAWTNAITNNQFIEEIYRRGYQDCEKDFEENKRRDFYHKVIVDRERR